DRRDGQEYGDGDQQGRGGGRPRHREQRPQERGQGVPAEDRIHRDLDRHRIEERHGAREQPEPEQARQLEPVRARLPQKPPVQGGAAHQTPLSGRRARPHDSCLPARSIARATAPMAAPHSKTPRSVTSNAARPRTTPPVHAPSRVAPREKPAKISTTPSPVSDNRGQARKRTSCRPAPWSSHAISKRATPRRPARISRSQPSNSPPRRTGPPSDRRITSVDCRIRSGATPRSLQIAHVRATGHVHRTPSPRQWRK